MFKRITLFILFIFVLISIPQTINLNDEYTNPELGILSIIVKEKEDGLPYVKRTFPKITSNQMVNKFYDFCTQIKMNFTSSNMTIEEADKLYSILDNYDYHEESWGMPSPDYKIPEFDVRKRIMIKKITNSTYEIFYSLSGCGAKVIYSRILVNGDKILYRENIQLWRIYSDC